MSQRLTSIGKTPSLPTYLKAAAAVLVGVFTTICHAESPENSAPAAEVSPGLVKVEPKPVAPSVAKKPAQDKWIESGPKWLDLTPAQQGVLSPLASTWSDMPEVRKKKWIEISGRYPNMSKDEQMRLQEKMREWAWLSPAERRQARENYKRVQEVPKEQRQQQWERYQQLSDQEKQALAKEAQKAKQAQTDTTRPAGPAATTRPTAKTQNQQQ
jgi:hypothetical protein